MIDCLFFGEDTTETRLSNDKNQRTFIKHALCQFPLAQIVDDYDAILGFRIKVLLPDEEKTNYYPWLFSTDWYGYSTTLNNMYNNMPNPDQAHAVKLYLALSQQRYPDCFSEERLKSIPAYS